MYSKSELAMLILNSLSMTSLASINNQIIPMLKKDIIATLPYEIVTRILTLTDHQSLCRASTVSKAWNRIARDNFLWRLMYFTQMWTINERSLSHSTSKPDGHRRSSYSDMELNGWLDMEMLDKMQITNSVVKLRDVGG